VGYIIKNRRMPIGIDNCLNLSESIYCPNSGRNFPTSKPTTMHIAIQSVRYFSKIPRVSVFPEFGESAMVDSLAAKKGRKRCIQVFKYVVSIT
jgi:hypothetical protein